MKFFISFALFLFCMPFIVLGWFVVPTLLACGWQGYTTFWGNAKWGNGAADPAYGKTGFWAAYVWLALRNPVNNLSIKYMAVTQKAYTLTGNANTGNETQGGTYDIAMGLWWEHYTVIPYSIFGSKRCVRFRYGWKINNGTPGTLAPFVFSFNPWMNYTGA